MNTQRRQGEILFSGNDADEEALLAILKASLRGGRTDVMLVHDYSGDTSYESFNSWDEYLNRENFNTYIYGVFLPNYPG